MKHKHSLPRRTICSLLCMALTVSMLCTGVVAKETEISNADETQVYAILGEKTSCENVRVWMGDTNEPVSTIKDGKNTWVMDPGLTTKNRYLYVDVDDGLIYDKRDGGNIEVEVEYFDSENSSVVLEYPKYNEINTSYTHPMWNKTRDTYQLCETPIFDFSGSQTWKKATWVLERAQMDNSLNGADFRISIQSSAMGYSVNPVYISSIKVKDLGTKSVADIDITSDNLGNIFFTGEKMKFSCSFDDKLNIASSENRKYDLAVTYTLTDSKNNIVSQKTENVPMELNTKKVTEVEFDVDKYDLYNIEVTAECKEKNIWQSVRKMCSYARTEYGEVRNERSGISLEPTVSQFDDIAELIKNAGYTYVRTQTGVNMMKSAYDNHREVNEVTTDVTINDLARAVKSHGLKFTAYVSSMVQNSNTYGLWIEDVGSANRFPYTDEGRQRWLDVTMGIIDQLHGSLDSWEISNESNIKDPLGDDKRAKDNALLDMLVYPKIKESYSDVSVGSCQMSSLSDAKQWFDNYFAAGGVGMQDAISIHPYTFKVDPITDDITDKNGSLTGGSLYDVRDVMEKYNLDVPVWASEYGFAAYYQQCYNDWLQACWDVQQYMQMTEENLVDKMFLFRFDNTSNEPRSNRESNFGIVHSGERDFYNRYAAKPGYLSQSNMNIMMHDAEYISKIKLNRNTVGYRYKKTDTNEEMFTMFTKNDADIMSVDLGVNKVLLTDIYGNEQVLTSDDGVYTFTITEAPMYCTGKFTKFETVDKSKAYPSDVIIGASSSTKSSVEIVNNSDKELTAVIETQADSTIDIANTVTLKPGKNKVDFSIGATTVADVEYIDITIKDGDDVCFKGSTAVHYSPVISMEISLAIDENGRWKIGADITNNSTESDVTGTFKLITPENIAAECDSQTITVEAGKTDKAEIYLPEEIDTSKSITGLVGFVLDEESGSGAYVSRTMDFAYAPKTKQPVTIDGNLDEWSEGFIYLNRTDQFESVIGYNNVYNGPDDLWAKVAVMWDDDNFYFAGEVHDDVHYATAVTPMNIWMVDSFQLGIVYDPYDQLTSLQFEEIAISNLDGVPTLYRHKTYQTGLADSTQVEGANLAIKQDGEVTYYELSVPWKSIHADYMPALEPGCELSFSVLLNENDSDGRKGFYMLGDGIANSKNSDLFVKLYLSE